MQADSIALIKLLILSKQIIRINGSEVFISMFLLFAHLRQD